MEELIKIAEQFQLEGTPVSAEKHGAGHINRTYLVKTDAGKDYILQKINDKIFPNVEGLMNNIVLVTDHVRTKVAESRMAMQVVYTKDGKSYLEEDGFWRVYVFVENSYCKQSAANTDEVYEGAAGFARFTGQLADFDATLLCEPIARFHDTPNRFANFHKALAVNYEDRIKTCQPEIEFYLAREHEAGVLLDALKRGEIPLRVTHNDTKLNNIMFDKDTDKAVCVIDLDTIMPGLLAYDFGDAVRFLANTAKEDETDLSKVHFDISYYETYVRAYKENCDNLTDAERLLFPWAAKLMTMECGVRFLTDYLEGDTYFNVSRPTQNLDRTRTHIRLVKEMEEKWEQMNEIAK